MAVGYRRGLEVRGRGRVPMMLGLVTVSLVVASLQRLLLLSPVCRWLLMLAVILLRWIILLLLLLSVSHRFRGLLMIGLVVARI